MSQQKVADLAGIRQMAVSKYERNMDMPGSAVLIGLEAALDTTIESLLRPLELNVDIQLFRKHASLSEKDDGSVRAQIQEWIERYLEIEQIVPDSKVPVDLPEHPYPVSSWEDIERAANKIRERWNLGTDPIRNLVELLEDKGIKVGLISGHEAFDACTFKVNNEQVIAVKEGIPGDRQRFNLAHELGHLVLDVENNKEGIDEEKAANRFAGAFLVSEGAAIHELGKMRSYISIKELEQLKYKYGMSMNAWIYRIMDLGILPKSKARQLFGYFRKNGWDKQEPGGELRSELPLRMERLVYRAASEEAISQFRAAELLGDATLNVEII